MKDKKKLVQFGAGNIGRSFIAQVFSSAGYEIVFVDINSRLIDELNIRHEYEVVIKDYGKEDKILTVKNVSGVPASDTDSVIKQIVSADLIATSVGKGALTRIAGIIGRGILERYNLSKSDYIDIIIAENIRNGALFLADELKKHLPENFPVKNYIGLIETSIGKSVPVVTEEEAAREPLQVFAEPYNLLILAANNLKKKLPESKNIKLVKNIQAYVDRKLFIHNLGHAAAAYFGNIYHPDEVYLSNILEDRRIEKKVRSCMMESAKALRHEYPEDFTAEDLNEHIDDLLKRFRNKALGDTVFRVGRDLQRKLEKNDRLLGAALLCEKHNLPVENIIEAIAAGLRFKAVNRNGEMFGGDVEFKETVQEKGLLYTLENICHLNAENSTEKNLIIEITNSYDCKTKENMDE